jgi:copper chaperone CopZ
MNLSIKKHINTILMALSLIYFTPSLVAQTPQNNDPQTVQFTVTQMGCSNDQKILETALYRKKGVKKVTIEGESVTVTYNPSKITVDALKSVIENTGTCEDPNDKIHKVKSSTP